MLSSEIFFDMSGEHDFEQAFGPKPGPDVIIEF